MSDANLQSDLCVPAEINLYYDLFIPSDSSQLAPLIIAVHGYGAHKQYMMREARLVAPEDFVIASVQAPHQHFRKTETGLRPGFGWVTDYRPDESIALHHNFLLQIVERFTDGGVIDPDRIFLYGFSQSCALNFRFAFTYPDILKGVIGVAGGIPGDLDTNEKYGTFTADALYLYGDCDEFYPFEKFQEFEQKLYNRLPNFTSKYYSAKHEITDEMRRDIRDFLGDR
ncbi:MAG: hypothetical protein WBD22_04485 [Pyrinomonadaceae bacterium]